MQYCGTIGREVTRANVPRFITLAAIIDVVGLVSNKIFGKLNYPYSIQNVVRVILDSLRAAHHRRTSSLFDTNHHCKELPRHS